MACACKLKSAGQVTARKQVVKRSFSKPVAQTSKPEHKSTLVKRVVFKRPI